MCVRGIKAGVRMREYNFDREISRNNTNSLKYDFAVERVGREDVLPLWLADMDFQTAEPVLDALHNAVNHGIFGYSEVKKPYYDAVSKWYKKHFGWETKEEWLVKTPGVVFALVMAICALTEEGDGVLIQTPVYHPLHAAILDNNRVLVKNELLYVNGHYEIDFADFEEKIQENGVKLFILCSPHNPVGRVWTKEELKRLGEICKRYGVIVASDEIHCDFTFPENPHTVFPVACPDLAEQTIVCTAPSKTFNLAGLQVSNIWISNKEMRQRILKEIERSGYSQLNSLGLVAAQAAYENGEEWFIQCREYLRGNLDYLRIFLKERLPEIKLVEPEGTYFAWLDCSTFEPDRKKLHDFIVNRAKLWLTPGYVFGEASGSFQRMVLACTRKTLREALERLEKAVKEIRR